MPTASPPVSGTFTLRPLTGPDAPLVQELLEAAPDYTRRTQARDVAPTDGTGVLTAVPPGLDPRAKTVLGLCDDAGSLLALADVLHGWPEPDTARIGLLLVRQDAQGAGLGRLLHETLLAQVRLHAGLRLVRAGIVSTNAEVAVPFWQRMGYRPTAEVHPHQPQGALQGAEMTTTIWEREIRDRDNRDQECRDHESSAPARDGHPSGLHHLELWTADLATTEPAWHWLLTTLGWQAERVEGWELGRIWRHRDGSYIVLEQSDDVIGDRSDRMRPGMNHLALTCPGRELLDSLRGTAAEHGWRERFAERYPHAGGEDHVAWYAEDPEGIEVEVVVEN